MGGEVINRRGLRARLVLSDCRVALDLLDSADDDAHFRLYWLACCTLLRTVGHVLHKVDAPQVSSSRADSIFALWETLKADRTAHPLFWEFIENERNRMVKEYRPNYERGEHMLIVPDESAEDWVSEIVGPDLYSPIGSGPFAGEDARDMLREAIAWWDERLRVIENA